MSVARRGDAGRWILQITAGVGPVETRAFVGRLAPTLTDICRSRGLAVEGMTTTGKPHAPSSAEVLIVGEAREALGDLLGTHVLIAPRAGRGRGDRKRWFAGVMLHPAACPAPGPSEVTLDPGDVELSACRAGGPGGQHVNTTASAVRALHRPSGVAVRVEDGRSQAANRKLALRRLAEVLARRERERADRQRRERRAVHYRLVRGAPIRTWRLAPRGQDAIVEVYG